MEAFTHFALLDDRGIILWLSLDSIAPAAAVDDAPFIGDAIWTLAADEAGARAIRLAFSDCLLLGVVARLQVTLGNAGIIRDWDLQFDPVDARPVFALRARHAPEETDLSEREREVLTLLCQDKSPDEVTETLGISKSTFNTHRANISQKLGATTPYGVAAAALRHGLIEL